MPRTVARRQRGEAAALPQWVAPQLTQLVDAAPDGDQWLHEIKYDGYRMHARLDRGAVKLLTRTGLDSHGVLKVKRIGSSFLPVSDPKSEPL
jgi:ATP-dependent DNA ligase